MTRQDDFLTLFICNNKSKNCANKIFLINNNLEIRYTGYENSDFGGTLIEGEYISKENIFLAYDILYYKGEDIRNKKLIIKLSAKKNKKINSRMEALDDFLSSKNTLFKLNNLNKENGLKITKKEFEKEYEVK